MLCGKKLKELTNLSQKRNNMSKAVKLMKKDWKYIKGGRRMTGKGEKIGFSKKAKNMKKSHGGDHE